MNLHKVTPTWCMNGENLSLSIHYWLPDEHSNDYRECSSEWVSLVVDGNFTASYNRLVDLASKEFNLKCLRKMNVAEKSNQIYIVPSGSSFGSFFMTFFVAIFIGIAIGIKFF